tara:strand:+ start:2019 stop:2396 length:378 start_codon:yes stop_codon:yes gene_type:complete
MIHLTPTASAQTIKVIPRSYPSSVKMTVRDDSTNTSTSYTEVSATTDKNYLVISKAFDPVLVDGRFYDLTIEEVSGVFSNVIYKDKIFCANQLISQSNNLYYSVNKNEYTTPSGDDKHDNDYIIV